MNVWSLIQSTLVGGALIWFMSDYRFGLGVVFVGILVACMPLLCDAFSSFFRGRTGR